MRTFLVGVLVVFIITLFYGYSFCDEFYLESSEVSHYEYVVVYASNTNFVDDFYISVLRDGGIVPDLLGRERVYGKVVGGRVEFIYIPVYGIKDGFYDVVVMSNGVEVFRSNFLVISRQQMKLREPLRVLTFEENVPMWKIMGDSRIGYKKVADFLYRVMVDANLNTFVMLGGQTTYLKDKKNIWYSVPLSNLVVLKYLKERGIQTGAYVMCFLTLGGSEKVFHRGYYPNLVYRKGRLTKEYKYVSIISQRRVSDIVDILTYIGRLEYVDFLGLDFIRVGDFGGYELFRDFYYEIYSRIVDNDLPYIQAPNGEKSLINFASRVMDNQKLRKLFRWYQSVRVSRVIKFIRDEVRSRGINKPIIAFMLGWNAGREHGQDLFMFRDAGVDYSFYMLYEFYSDEMFEEAGRFYLTKVYNLDTQIVFGNIIDSYLNRGKSSPLDNFSGRLRKIVMEYSYFPPNGFFFHDVYRLFHGRIKPYSSFEWIDRIKETSKFLEDSYFRREMNSY